MLIKNGVEFGAKIDFRNSRQVIKTDKTRENGITAELRRFYHSIMGKDSLEKLYSPILVLLLINNSFMLSPEIFVSCLADAFQAFHTKCKIVGPTIDNDKTLRPLRFWIPICFAL
jgi:hypothetical protein